MSPLKVLFLSRSNLLTVPAGDTVQVLNTKRALESLGVQVDLKKRPPAEGKTYDLVHLFNTIPINDVYSAFVWARDKGHPIALSTIYWDAAGWIHESGKGSSLLKRLEWWEKTQPLRSRLISEVDLLLPNAQGELEKIKGDFQLSELPYALIPNAADPIYASGSEIRFRKRHQIYREFILCSARIDARKNQIALIKALANTHYQLVFVGAPGERDYFLRFQAELGPNCHYLGALNQRELRDVYAAARVHALPSWYDTPGLASLEAGLAGCSLVSTSRGTAREYLQEDAWYCDPGDLESIKQAVQQAYQSPPSEKLRQRIITQYNWRRVGELTLKAYQRLLVK